MAAFDYKPYQTEEELDAAIKKAYPKARDPFGKETDPAYQAKQQVYGDWQAYRQKESALAPMRRLVDQQEAAGAPKLQAEGPYQSNEAAYQKKSFSAPLAEFDPIRQRAQQKANQTIQSGTDALRRRFAAMGNLNSGAALKSEDLLRQQAQDQASKDMQDIDFQEAQTRRGLEEAETGREFQSNEAAKQRSFAGSESVNQRNLNRDMANMDSEFKQRVANIDSRSKLAQLDLAYDDAQLSKTNSAANAKLNQMQIENSGGLFGGGGVLGLGSWLCSEANKVFALCDLEKKALSLLLRHSRRSDRSFTKFYLTQCDQLISKIKESSHGNDWIKSNNLWIREMIHLVQSGKTEDAFISYRSHVVGLISEYWPECNHPSYLEKVQLEKAG